MAAKYAHAREQMAQMHSERLLANRMRDAIGFCK